MLSVSENRSELAGFDRIYSTDLVYIPDCWKLCGDAHCCSFTRYKSQFKLIARTHFQELPLLPGEFEYLQSRGWLDQFGDHEHKVVEFPIDDGVVRAESIVSLKQHCACEHATRPTICRLYPRLPVFSVDGRLLGTEVMGVFEEMERIEQSPPACQIDSISFEQMTKFLDITSVLSQDPLRLFYLEAYRLTKAHVTARLRERRASSDKNVLSIFETGFMRRSLIDADQLRSNLNTLSQNFKKHYGSRFTLN